LAIAERQRSAIASHPWSVRPVSASFGVSTRRPTTGDSTTLVEEADRALYRSKSRGRDRVTHHDGLEAAQAPPDAPPEAPAASADASRVQKELDVFQRRHDAAWDALDRFMKALVVSGEAPGQYRSVLSAVREGTEAEIVFLCTDQ